MKALLFTLLFFSMLCFSFSQSLTLSDGQQPVPNNGDIFLSGGYDPLVSYITVNNIAGAERTVECKKALLQDVAGSMNYFCWGACYAPETTTGDQPVIIPANQSNAYNFSGHYDCQGNAGTAVIRYTFWVIGSPHDSVCFNVHYSECFVGLTELQQLRGLSEPFPNPSHDYVSIRYSINPAVQANIDLVTLQGELVRRIPVPGGTNATSLSVSGLSKGGYFLLLSENGLIISRKKLIVE